jgi:hypothetical protein
MLPVGTKASTAQTHDDGEDRHRKVLDPARSRAERPLEIRAGLCHGMVE